MAILAIPFPTFQPAMRIISAITNSQQATITTTFAHQYITGTIVRIDIPPRFGMQEIDQQFGPIVVTSPTTFTIAVDSTLFSTFFTSTQFPFSQQYPQAVPFAENNNILTAATQNVLPYKAI